MGLEILVQHFFFFLFSFFFFFASIQGLATTALMQNPLLSLPNLIHKTKPTQTLSVCPDTKANK